MKMRGARQSGLTYFQVLVLIVLFAGASVVIFFFGLWVGRDAAERRLLQEERIVRAPIVFATPSPAHVEERPEEAVDRAFYERLRQKAAERLAQSNPSPLAVETAPTVAPPTQGRIAPTVAAPLWLPTPTPLWPRVTPRPTNTPRPRPTPTAPPRLRDEGRETWADAGWTVQVTATTDATEARALVQRLRSRGYDAYLVQVPSREGATWYRVRVGRFSSREEAQQWERRLKNEAGLSGAFVTPR
ncbi:MAG: SPOR domain-containing protein [Candidatus Binatia bacterium]|nr:SPOR domain-containing protein [Candidatus Binatia bacterium]